MTSDADIAAQRLLDELAELSLATARDLSAAIHQTEDTAELVALADAYAKIGRCLRMSVALAMRLRRGERLSPAVRDEIEIEREEIERDESVFIEERPEGLERENLYDRLPSGDLPTQIATVARTLSRAASVLPAAAAYRARCATLAADAQRLAHSALERPPSDNAWPTAAASPGAGVAIATNRSRGPPSALN
jgi:hypothetical protein